MDQVVETSRLMIRKGSKSFYAASRLFDPETRQSAYMLYAWCRYCDDQIDNQNLGMRSANEDHHSAQDRLTTLYQQTQTAFTGEPVAHPVFIAFQRVVKQHQIPERYPFELLQGFTMDVSGHYYATLEDTLRYAYHVAGVVGVMMAYVMGIRDEEILDRAADLGIAFQLTNIVRDVAEDARIGRIYLPEQWLIECGVPPKEIMHRRHRAAVFEISRRLLKEADRYYDSAKSGLPRLSFRSAWAIATAQRIYRDIGIVILKRKQLAWDTRAIVSRRRKLYCVMAGAIDALAAVTVQRWVRPTPREGLWIRPKN